MDTVIVTLAVVAVVTAIAWARGYVKFGQCECGPEHLNEAIKAELDRRSQPDPLQQLAENAAKLLKAKDKPPTQPTP